MTLPKILPDFNYILDSLLPIDILVIPSADEHLDKDLEDTIMLSFVRDVAKSAKFVTSHYGAFVLAEKGRIHRKTAGKTYTKSALPISTKEISTTKYPEKMSLY